MKKLLQTILILLLSASTGIQAYAQESIIGEINYADLQKYIALAQKNYPRKKMFEVRKEAVKTGIPMAQVSYLDAFTATYFYRPEDKAVLNPINPYNVNGFQFSINVNLGNFLQKPFQVKRAKAEYKLAELEAQDYNIELITEVKSRYYDYIQRLNELKIYTQMGQDNKGVFEALRGRFEKGEITLDAYNQSRISLSSASTSRIQAEVSYLKAKDLLEDIIGEKLPESK